jgi:hypothetical protein
MLFLQALQALKDSTPLSYSPHALQHFQCEWEGPKVGHVELVEKDGVMVYQQVRWLHCVHNAACAVCLTNHCCWTRPRPRPDWRMLPSHFVGFAACSAAAVHISFWIAGCRGAEC